MKRLAIIGAGPIGLDAALLAAERGLDATVFEQGEVGDAIRRWGPTRLFSPMAMNVSPRMRKVLDGKLPADDAILTGPDFVARVLLPIAAQLGERVRTRSRVVSVGRARLGRGDLAGHPLRDERPFRLLLDGPSGARSVEADAVLDASGVYGRATWAGAGGQPALGERALGERIIRHLGALHARRPSLAEKKILLVGHGHSAATALALFDALARESPPMRVTWATRSANLRPLVEVARDPL